jgi:peptidoglycan/xylan/chitin deacetylase (PgdA/CDA1 family)
MDSNLLSHIAWWLGVPRKTIELYSLQISQASLNLESLRIYEPALSDQIARKVAFHIMKRTSPENRTALKSILKTLRRWVKKENTIFPEMAPVKETPWHQTLSILKKQMKKPGTLSSLKTGLGPVICLTHDIDSIDCYEAISTLAGLEQKYGIPSVFNFLTEWDYNYQPELARSLDSDGFEIGLHGLTHDIAIGYRSQKAIRLHIEKALDQLGVPVYGYRAPAFAITENLIKVLDVLGIKYDSSVHMWHPMYPSLSLSFPYRYPASQIIEFPITIEDDMLFSDFKLNENQAIKYIEKTLDAIIGIGGVFVINIHPYRMKTQPRLIEAVLKIIKNTGDQVLKTTPKSIIDNTPEETFLSLNDE